MSAELAYLSADHWPCDLKCCVSIAVVASCSRAFAHFFRSLVKCQTYILAECCVSWLLCFFFALNAHSLAFVNTSFEKHVYLLVWQFRRTKQCYLFQHNSHLSSWNLKSSTFGAYQRTLFTVVSCALRYTTNLVTKVFFKSIISTWIEKFVSLCFVFLKINWFCNNFRILWEMWEWIYRS